MRARLIRLAAAAALTAGCAGSETNDDAAPEPVQLCERVAALDEMAAAESYAYTWSCGGEVAASETALPLEPVAEDCVTGIWPDLDDTVDVCPTISDASRIDPVSGKTLPTTGDDRGLPVEIPVSESGSYLPASAPAEWPAALRVVAWNMEYTARLDEQLETLTGHPELSVADVYLLSEVDRCSARNDLRRAARLLAQALDAEYVYGIEFVELEIDRVAGGDTGQAIVSRRPLTGAALTCHSSQFDWLATEDEPRLGQRVVLHADVPAGDQQIRLYSLHLESNDLFGDKRSVQAKELLDQAQERACERPQIITGDFNAPYCGAPELEVLRTAGFVDAVGLTGDTEPTHQAGMRLDYVWTRGFAIVGGGVVRDVRTSDHYPLWIDIELL